MTMAMATSFIAHRSVSEHRQIIRTRTSILVMVDLAPSPAPSTRNKNNEGEDQKPRRFSKSVKGDMRYETNIECPSKER